MRSARKSLSGLRNMSTGVLLIILTKKGNINFQIQLVQQMDVTSEFNQAAKRSKATATLSSSTAFTYRLCVCMTANLLTSLLGK